MINNELSIRGQSLFEVIFSLAVVALILAGIVPLASVAIRNATFSRNNSLATKYSQEASEWVREQRDTSWSNLSANLGTKNLGNLSWTAADCVITGMIFCRQITLSSTLVGRVDSIITVSWQDALGTHTVRNANTFTNWNP